MKENHEGYNSLHIASFKLDKIATGEDLCFECGTNRCLNKYNLNIEELKL